MQINIILNLYFGCKSIEIPDEVIENRLKDIKNNEILLKILDKLMISLRDENENFDKNICINKSKSSCKIAYFENTMYHICLDFHFCQSITVSVQKHRTHNK